MIGDRNPVAIALKIGAVLVLLLALYWLPLYFEATRVGAISVVEGLLRLILSIAIPVALWLVARKIDRRNSSSGKA